MSGQRPVVSVGTSLPELVTSVIAARRGQAGMALGNVLGSNVFNVLGILGLTAAFVPLGAPAEIAAFDIWVLLGVTALLMLFLRTGWTISRREGVVFFAAYVGYVGWQLAGAL